MMTSFYRNKCSVCNYKISDKTHEWCQKMGLQDVCYDHIPVDLKLEIAKKRYGKTQYSTLSA